MERSRVVGVLGEHSLGSGYLLSANVALTSAHVVQVVGGATQLFRPGISGTAWGTVVWCGTQGGVDDAALVRIDNPSWVSFPTRPVRWGRLVTDDPVIHCETWGIPDTEQSSGHPWEAAHLSATTNSGTGFVANQYVLELDRSPEDLGYGKSPWSGLSGGAVFCGEVLIGVVKADLPLAQHRRLAAVPAYVLIHDPSFRQALDALGVGVTFPEPAEFQDLCEPPAPTVIAGRRGSPAELLRADRQTVPFYGRSALIEEIEQWCSEPDLGVFLIHGEGGSGKTRLAVEVTKRVAKNNVAAIWLARQSRTEGLRRANRPLLIVVDYADTRVVQLLELLHTAAHRSHGSSWKLLLLARSARSWWEMAKEASSLSERLLADVPVRLAAPLEPDAEERLISYRTAVHAFSDVLTISEPTACDWSAAAASLATPDLSATSFSNALTLHMAALVDLLDAGQAIERLNADETLREAACDIEERLLGHERRYWELTASSHGQVSILTPETRRKTMLASTLLGSPSRQEVDSFLIKVPGLGDDYDRRLSVASWLADTYQSTTDEKAWGQLLPDRLAEHYAGSEVLKESRILDSLLREVTQEQQSHLLIQLTRSAGHDILRDRLSEIIVNLCVRHCEFLDQCIASVACQVERAEPLLLALDRIVDSYKGNTDRLWGLVEVATTSFLGHFQRDPGYRAFQDRLLGVFIDEFRRVVQGLPSAEDLSELDPLWLGQVADAMRTLATYQSEAGNANAERLIEEAIEVRHWVEYPAMRSLQQFQVDYSTILINLGRPDEGLMQMRKGLDYFDSIAGIDLALHPYARSEYKQELYHLRHHLADTLRACGDYDEAARMTEERIQLNREEANSGVDSNYRLAASLFLYAQVMRERNQDGDSVLATVAAEEALSLLERLPQESQTVSTRMLAQDLQSLIRVIDEII